MVAGNSKPAAPVSVESQTVARETPANDNPKVTLQPCDMRGKVKEGSAVVEATAEVLVGEAAHPIRDAIRNRHKLMTSMFKVTDLFRRVVLRKNPAECAIRIVL